LPCEGPFSSLLPWFSAGGEARASKAAGASSHPGEGEHRGAQCQGEPCLPPRGDFSACLGGSGDPWGRAVVVNGPLGEEFCSLPSVGHPGLRQRCSKSCSCFLSLVERAVLRRGTVSPPPSLLSCHASEPAGIRLRCGGHSEPLCSASPDQRAPPGLHLPAEAGGVCSHGRHGVRYPGERGSAAGASLSI